MRETLGHLIKQGQAAVSRVEDTRRSLDHWRSFAADAIGKTLKRSRHVDPIEMATERFDAFRASLARVGRFPPGHGRSGQANFQGLVRATRAPRPLTATTKNFLTRLRSPPLRNGG
ncbi:hypothetical protein [uncultured Sphingomonas sp.]|uniref:hypothetical protein n=1 Tax=uncultured Sphingomonas sp. TaxID=158754 RepID=UPI0030F50EF4